MRKAEFLLRRPQPTTEGFCPYLRLSKRKELYAASKRAIQELAGQGRRVNIDALKKALKARVRDVLRKRNSSFAVVLPVISVRQSGYYDDISTYEKDFF